MQRLRSLLGFLHKYRRNVSLNILSNIFMVVFSVFSIPMLIPFLEILFGQKELVTEAKPSGFDIPTLVHNFNYELSQIIINNGKERALIYLCVAIVVIFFLKNLFRYLSVFFIASVRNGIVRDIRQNLFDKILVLPLSYFSDEKKGDIMSRVTVDVQEIENSILSVVETIIREPLMIVGALSFMIYLSSSLTFFVFFLLIFTAVVIGGIGKALKKQSSKVLEKQGALISTLEESLSGLRIIKAFNAEGEQSRKFLKENNSYRTLLTRLLWRRDLSSPLSEFMGITVVAVLIWYGFREVNSGAISVAAFIAFLYAFFTIIEPAKKFASASYKIQKGIAAVERIEVILNAENNIKDAPDAQSFSNFQSAVEFKDVSFYYKKEDGAVVENINFKIPKGKTVALVGSSGAGKSTLADLLPRFYDVSEGVILIDGKDIRNIKLNDLREQMGIVSQEAILFNETIFNNIAFGKKGITEAQVIAAAKIANAHDFIMETDQGYQTNIGDRGMKLSGGQRQRLTIARAVLKDPPILILDEATSALDSESEKLVQDALEKLLKNRTSLVIAHRLSTIQHADEILVMKEGHVIERGTHHELLSQNGEYGKLVALQNV